MELDFNAQAAGSLREAGSLGVWTLEDQGRNLKGRWRVFEAIDVNVSAPVITESLIPRLRWRGQNTLRIA